MSDEQLRLISPALLRLLDAERDPVFFVEIGANDGESFDPLAPFVADRGWRGLMVEPIPHVFARLRGNHGENDRVRLLNAAVGAEDGTRTIHHIREGAADPALPPWSDAIASFDRGHVLAQIEAAADPESLIAELEVECLSFATLCERHDVGPIDLLLIDAEGADWEILRSIDLEARRPRLIAYEHHHMAAAEREACEAMLGRHGYTLAAEGLDTWALDATPDDGLSERWRRVLAAGSA